MSTNTTTLTPTTLAPTKRNMVDLAECYADAKKEWDDENECYYIDRTEYEITFDGITYIVYEDGCVVYTTGDYHNDPDAYENVTDVDDELQATFEHFVEIFLEAHTHDYHSEIATRRWLDEHFR